MKSFFKSSLGVAAVCMAMICLASCSSKQSERELFECIPADARMVALVNFRNLALQSGCDVQADGNIQLSEDVEALFEGSDVATQSLVNILSLVSPCIDDEKIIWFASSDGSPIVLFRITDEASAQKKLSDYATASTSAEGYNVYAFPECVVLTDGTIGKIARTAQIVLNLDDNWNGDFFTEHAPVSKIFKSESHDLELILNNAENTRSELQYVTGFADFKTGGAYAEFQFMDEDGKVYEFSNDISTVDRRLLKYIPVKTEALVAVGKVKDWDKVFSVLENNSPKEFASQYGPYVQMAKSYLNMVDGTILFAVAPIAGEQALRHFSLETWQMLFMAHLPEEEIKSTLDMLHSLMELQGVESRQTSDTNWEISYQGQPVNYGTVDGYIYFANYDVMNAGNIEFANSYEAKQAAFELLIPYNSETMKALHFPWGVDLNIFLSKKNVRVTLRLPGGTGPVLKELISSMVNTGAMHVVND